MPPSPTIHATCFIVDGHGILIRGASGAGKSRLALHFIETAVEKGRTATLVADDRVHLEAVEGRLVASVPASIAGLIERRTEGLRDRGIERIDFEPSTAVSLVVDILPDGAFAVDPCKFNDRVRLEGIELPYLTVSRDFREALASIEQILSRLEAL